MVEYDSVLAALESVGEDQLVFDLAGIRQRYDSLLRELPGSAVRFAIKSCPAPELLDFLAEWGSGFDAASPRELALAIEAGAPIDRIHYGNTVKSDEDILAAYRLGVRDFATDSVEDVASIAAHAPGSRAFCRIATSGEGAFWGLSRKYGCSTVEAVRVLATAKSLGLKPSGLSFHVGSQQMTAAAWTRAFTDVAEVMVALRAHGIVPDHVNIGGGLPALGYLDPTGTPLVPPIGEMLASIRAGMDEVRRVAGAPIGFKLEPGRHLVADSGAIKTRVSRFAVRELRNGEREHWLYLSCGKFNGLYELDQVVYPFVFPTHIGEESAPAVVGGPTCDSDDIFFQGRPVVHVPTSIRSGDPVWILSSGAYSISYATVGFNGFLPLPATFVRPLEGVAC
jgi:ornithine decarboxylase